MIGNLKNGSLIHPLLVNDDVPFLLSDVAKTISDLSPSYGLLLISISITLWLFNIAMEHGPFIDGLPIKHDDFPWLC